MKKILLLLLVFYPLLFLFDKTQGTTYFIGYHQFLLKTWPYLLAIAVSFYLLKKHTYYRYDEMEKLRYRLYQAERNRWLHTPYVPPIMLMYLKNPPGPYSPFLYDYVNNTFYRTVVNDFRDRVYILSDFDSFEPDSRDSYIETVGMRSIMRIVFYLGGVIVWLFYWVFLSPSGFLEGWEVFSIPLIVVGLYRSYTLIQVYLDQRYSILDEQYELNDVNRKITWREAFPDTEIGKTFTRAYYVEMERRARFNYQLRNQRVPENMEEFNNPNFAPYPYPAQSIPQWENEYEMVMEQKQQELNESSKKVVPLRLM